MVLHIMRALDAQPQNPRSEHTGHLDFGTVSLQLFTAAGCLPYCQMLTTV